VQSLAPYFESAEKEISIFAGNLSFIHLKHNKKTIFDHIKKCVNKKIHIKIITDINLVDLDNIEKCLSINAGLKEPLLKIRHGITPLRAYIFDNTIVKLGEIMAEFRKQGQIKEIIAVYYEIREEAWIEWVQKLFWKKFQNSIPSRKRIDDLRTISKLG